MGLRDPSLLVVEERPFSDVLESYESNAWLFDIVLRLEIGTERTVNRRFEQRLQHTSRPPPRNQPKRRVFELLGMANGIPELAVVVDAAGEEVVEQALLDELQLSDDLLSLAYGIVDG